MLHANGNLEAPHKHTGVYITDETHPGERISTAHSHPVSPVGHVNHNGVSI